MAGWGSSSTLLVLGLALCLVWNMVGVVSLTKSEYQSRGVKVA